MVKEGRITLSCVKKVLQNSMFLTHFLALTVGWYGYSGGIWGSAERVDLSYEPLSTATHFDICSKTCFRTLFRTLFVHKRFLKNEEQETSKHQNIKTSKRQNVAPPGGITFDVLMFWCFDVLMFWLPSLLLIFQKIPLVQKQSKITSCSSAAIWKAGVKAAEHADPFPWPPFKTQFTSFGPTWGPKRVAQNPNLKPVFWPPRA